ncbi:MAG TPA: RtcB family protein [Planctomycetota bacterium]|nr:RtcB family protein [Planctomycetota bacterium]
MDPSRLERRSAFEWIVPASGRMRVPGVLYATESLLRGMDEKVREQLSNVASLPGIVGEAHAMPDAHWGYGFPIGGVAAFDEDEGGVVSAGGVGFDIACGVRTIHTGLSREEVERGKRDLAERLFRAIPVGVGAKGRIRLDDREMRAMLAAGARWAVERGYGEAADLDRIEERGSVAGAEPERVSERARERQREEVGTLGSGNHYLEVQAVADVFDSAVAKRFALEKGSVVLSIHCGSRGLGHQIGTEFLKRMTAEAPSHGLHVPDRELACAPIRSELGRAYLGAMRAAIHCALANRQVLTHLVREVFGDLFRGSKLEILYDVSHNTCKVEEHVVGGRRRRLHVHRKGATRAFGPGHPELAPAIRDAGQPVLVGGSMGTASWVLAGTERGMEVSFGSACHGAGRAMSRSAAGKRWDGGQVARDLEARGVLVRSPSRRGIAEEAPGAYKDVDEVVEATERAGLAKRVARLVPIVCVKG